MADASDVAGGCFAIHPGEGMGLPVVYSNDAVDASSTVRRRCAELGCPPFHLVTISGLAWEQALSPWRSEPVVSKDDKFTGNAPDHLRWMLEELIPNAQRELRKVDENLGEAYISGYSMAGLFSLWSLYQTDFFAGAVCASGSVWFPDFDEFALTHELAREPRAIYLSLGDQETKTKNRTLRRSDEVLRKLHAHYTELGIRCTYETNPGGHFKDIDLRVAKGITWLLGQR